MNIVKILKIITLVAIVAAVMQCLRIMYKDPSDRFLVRLGRLSYHLGQHELEAKHITLVYPDMPSNLEGLKIAHITDLHFENNDTLHSDLLSTVVTELNKSNANLTLITGDFVSHDAGRAAKLVSEAFKDVPKVYGVLGDHDNINNVKDQVKTKLETIGKMIILENSAIEDVLPNLTLVGFGNLRDKNFRSLITLHPLKNKKRYNFMIAMSHNPDTAKCLLEDRSCAHGIHIDLLLTGHTHGSQFVLPYFNISLGKLIYIHFSWITSVFESIVYKIAHMRNVVDNWNWDFGLFEFQHPDTPKVSKLYVNKGLSSHLGLRINCRPELVIFTLTKKQQ
jgi:predicted MPP superfamily phosphohydrolase